MSQPSFVPAPAPPRSGVQGHGETQLPDLINTAQPASPWGNVRGKAERLCIWQEKKQVSSAPNAGPWARPAVGRARVSGAGGHWKWPAERRADA